MAPRRRLRWKSERSTLATAACLCWLLSPAFAADSSGPKPGESTEETARASEAPPAAPTSATTATVSATAQREDLNLLGVTDANSGESRRNENVQFNPVDNNALRELNSRVGITATIVEQFKVDRSYFRKRVRPPGTGAAPPGGLQIL